MIICSGKICQKEASTYDKGICCDHCNWKVYHSCNALNDADYKK